MHRWGDEWTEQYGADLDDAVRYIGLTLLRWRVPVRDYKEKFGTVRVYTGLGWSFLHDMTHPGHAYRRYKWDWVWRLSCKSCGAWWWSPIARVSFAIHRRIYRRVYGNAVRMWPHLCTEILCMADWRELLKGLVSPAHCTHGHVWERDTGRECGVCGADLPPAGDSLRSETAQLRSETAQ